MERFRQGMERFRPAAIGMDLDRQSLKAVQVSKSEGDYTLQHVGYRRLPPGAILAGEVVDQDMLAYEIREFWDTHAFRGRSVLLGIASQKVVVRLLDFPRMEDPEDLKSAISFEAQDHIPMPIEEAILDHAVLGPQSEGSDLDRILLVAAQRDMISRYTSAVRAGGLRPVGIDVKALSLLRSTLPNPLFEDEEAILLMDIGSEITNLAVIQDGVPTLTRFIPSGAIHFSQAVSETADIPEEEAETQMLDPRVRIWYGPEDKTQPLGEVASGDGSEDFDPALVYDVRRGLEEAVQALAEDVQRSIEYHYSQPGAREVSRISLSGEGAMVGGIEGYLGELLGVRVQRGGPLPKLAANRSNVSDDQLKVMEPVLAVAVGLALEEA